MPWSASIVYAQATAVLVRLLADDPVLGPELHHIRRLPARERGGRAPHGLPAGGLLAVSDAYPPDICRRSRGTRCTARVGRRPGSRGQS